MIIQFNLLYIFLRLILIVVLYIIPLDTYSVEAEETNAEKIKIRKVLKQLNEKNDYIKTAKISGKVFYNLPKDKKIKLYKKYKIKRKSKIHIDIYILIRVKVAEFISDGIKVQYKRIKKRIKNRDASDFNLNIFNKHLNLDLTVEELNNMLLGLSLVKLEENDNNYKVYMNKLHITKDSIKTIINMDTNEIEKIIINDSRKAEITFTNYKNLIDYDSITLDDDYDYNNLYLRGGTEIKLPLSITLTAPTFSMKIKHKNDIIINKEISDKDLEIDEKKD
ncbi:hypothetical protein CL650_003135 [bacterium]|nr:hypothetical protein [bacterium]